MTFLNKVTFLVCFIALCGAFFEIKANPITISSGSYNFNYGIFGSTSVSSLNYNFSGSGLSVNAASNPNSDFAFPVRGTLTLQGVSSNVLYDFSNSVFNITLTNPNIPLTTGNFFTSQQLQSIGAMVDSYGVYQISNNFTLNGALTATEINTNNVVYTTQIYGFGIANIAYAPLISNGTTVGYYLTSYSLNFQPTTTQPVPEPLTILLFGTGLAGIGFLASRRKKKN